MRRSKHTLSNYRLLSANMGTLYPINVMEILPGDTVQQATSILCRMSPLAAPVMHPATIRVHHWFVPHRLVWDPDKTGTSFEDFITGGPDGNDASTTPTINTTATAKDMLDYMGLPQVSGIPVSALPVRAMNMIWNEHYRDQDLQTERTLSDLSLPKVTWEKDYFTSSRPWSQKGNEVSLPLGNTANITGLGMSTAVGSSASTGWRETGGTTISATNGWRSSIDELRVKEDPNNLGFPLIQADLTGATAATVNEVRRAFALQRFAEARARYGSRYTEYLRYLGVESADSRLDRPEYLGGGRVKLSISEVLQLGPDSSDASVGDMLGHGIGALRTNRFRRYFQEHGHVISVLSVRPKAMYLNGIHRSWLRTDREDYYQRELQHIGQQEVQVNEVWAKASGGDATWGWQDRYREYGELPSGCSGEFRTSTLNHWHMARSFASEPALNETFVECDPTKRIFQVQSNDTLWVMAQHNIVARRMVERSAGGKIV